MVLHRETGKIEHCRFGDLPSFLLPSDLLVINETRVVPALLTGHKITGGRIEILVMDPAGMTDISPMREQAVRTCLVRSSKPLRQHSIIITETGAELIAEEVLGQGKALIRFPVSNSELLFFLDKWGQPPLPPYIRNESRNHQRDRAMYQTVYSRVPGSVAAPTAGLHFTAELLSELERRGVQIARIVLHVGPGTFQPVRNEDIRLHSMESEFFLIPDKSAEILRSAYEAKRRIISVGTTSLRALESAAQFDTTFRIGPTMTKLFVTPGYDFKVVQGLVTNFHLPGSTLLMLACAFGGKELVMQSYKEAIEKDYRFYSYGDASLII